MFSNNIEKQRQQDKNGNQWTHTTNNIPMKNSTGRITDVGTMQEKAVNIKH